MAGETVAARFWSKVNVGEPDECWEWQEKSRHEHGYGVFRPTKDSGTVKAHRFAWSVTNGEIPSGQVLRHKCDNPPCCNPNHLVIGTQADNVADMHERNRREYHSRLNPELLAEIKDRIQKGETQKSIALDLGVSQSYISMLASNIRGVTLRKVEAHGK